MRAHVGEGGGGRRERASKQAMTCNKYKLGACKGEGRGGEGAGQATYVMNISLVQAKHIKITVYMFPPKISPPTFLGLWYYLKALMFVQIAVLR